MTALPAPGAPGEPADAGSTRERLLAAAVEVFERQGYEGARLQDIARAAGLTTGAVYANFRSKADLLFEAMDARAGIELDTMLHGAAGRDVRHLLGLLGDGLVAERDQVPLLLDAVVAARRDDELAAALRSRLDGREQLITGLLERARGDGALAADLDAATFSRFCLTLAMGALVMRTFHATPPDSSAWHDLISRLLDAVTEEQAE